MKTRIIGYENEVRLGEGRIVRTGCGWQHTTHPFRRPIHHLRDARRAYRDQNGH